MESTSNEVQRSIARFLCGVFTAIRAPPGAAGAEHDWFRVYPILCLRRGSCCSRADYTADRVRQRPAMAGSSERREAGRSRRRGGCGRMREMLSVHFQDADALRHERMSDRHARGAVLRALDREDVAARRDPGVEA